jgi:hypothetical protein
MGSYGLIESPFPPERKIITDIKIRLKKNQTFLQSAQ